MNWWDQKVQILRFEVPLLTLLICIAIFGVFFAVNSMMDFEKSQEGNNKRKKPVIGPVYYSMPKNAEAYKKTKVFTESSIPEALKNNHSTSAGVWGLVHVLKGRIRYSVAPDNHCNTEQHYTIDAEYTALIIPKALHRVTVLTEETEFYVEFWKIPQNEAQKKED